LKLRRDDLMRKTASLTLAIKITSLICDVLEAIKPPN
jgi:hypothetical protein